MEKFGLLGKTLKHSFSPQIHKLFNDYQYDLIEIDSDSLESFVKSGKYKEHATVPADNRMDKPKNPQ